MKYRILKQNGIYRIQIKDYLFWYYILDWYDDWCSRIEEWGNYNDALRVVNELKEKRNNKPNKYWRVIDIGRV